MPLRKLRRLNSWAIYQKANVYRDDYFILSVLISHVKAWFTIGKYPPGVNLWTIWRLPGVSMFTLSRLCTCDIPGGASRGPVVAMFILENYSQNAGPLSNQIVYNYLLCDALFIIIRLARTNYRYLAGFQVLWFTVCMLNITGPSSMQNWLTVNQA